MKFSVITVSFNSEETIGEAVASVSNQDYTNFEHLIIDGASKDRTVEIARHYANPNTKIISEPDRGIYDAMNKGLDCATGDVVCFLNSDDRYAHPRVLSLVENQMLGSDLEALMGDVGYFRKDKPSQIVRRYRSDRFHPSRLAFGWMPAHPALFLSRAVVQRVGRFKIDYRIAADFEYIIRIFYGHDLRYRHLPEVLVHMQTGGVSTNGWRSKILLNREVLRACRENGLQTNMLKILSKYPAKMLELLQK